MVTALDGIRARWVGATIMALLAADASGQSVADVRDTVRSLGKQWDGEINAATTRAYAALHEAAERTGVRRVTDRSYGPHALQTVDVVWPASAGRDRAVVIYLHGGGFVRGDKSSAAANGLIYDNVATFFARHGLVGVNANYRLAPEAQWPAGADDIRTLLEWLESAAEEFGGDPQRIFLMGNSAGAAHVATYLFYEASQRAGGPGVAGALLSSGAFAAERGDSEYYGADSAENRRRAPLALLQAYEGPLVPMFLWSAELDPPFIEQAVAAMYAGLCNKYDDCPRFTQFQGHNHVSHVMSLNSADDEVGRAVLDFLEAAGAEPVWSEAADAR